MQSRNLHKVLITAGLVCSVVATGLFVWRSRHLPSQGAQVTVGMSQLEVEAILGPPYMTLNRQGGRGSLQVWIDDFWQLDVLIDSEGRVERVTCVPSNSFYRRTVEWLKSWME